MGRYICKHLKYRHINYVQQKKGLLFWQAFFVDAHITLKKCFEIHINKVRAKDLKANSKDILRAGSDGSHGEIRALDELLKEIDPLGKLGDDIFDNIIGYNRFLRQFDKIQPPCVHCHFITKGIHYLGF